jgi:hypothetical protein
VNCVLEKGTDERKMVMSFYKETANICPVDSPVTLAVTGGLQDEG